MSVLDRWAGRRPDRIATVWGDGVLAGLLAGTAVLVVFAVYDFHASEVLRTPSVLHAHFFDGSATASSVATSPVRALEYALVHYVLWCALGISGAYLLAVSRIYPRLWYAGVLIPALIVVFLLWTAGVWGIPGLGVHHLWVGALLGCLVMYGCFLWRNPDLRDHLDDA